MILIRLRKWIGRNLHKISRSATNLKCNKLCFLPSMIEKHEEDINWCCSIKNELFVLKIFFWNIFFRNRKTMFCHRLLNSIFSQEWSNLERWPQITNVQFPKTRLVQDMGSLSSQWRYLKALWYVNYTLYKMIYFSTRVLDFVMFYHMTFLGFYIANSDHQFKTRSWTCFVAL